MVIVTGSVRARPENIERVLALTLGDGSPDIAIYDARPLQI